MDVSGTRGRTDGAQVQREFCRDGAGVTERPIGVGSQSRVVQALYDLGPASRAELSRATGLSRASVTGIVAHMLEQGLVVEGPLRNSGAAGGKPSRPLWFSPTGPMIAAAHLLPGSLSIALVSLTGEPLLTRTPAVDTDRDDAALHVSGLIAAELTSMRAELTGPVLGLGIAVGGMVDTATGTVIRIDLARSFDGSPLGPMVQEATGLTTVIDLHPRAQALGDRWFGLGRGHSSFASVYASEALGVGLVLDGSLQRGTGGAGGEIGHSIVQVDGEECLCGQRGCWETIASHRWLAREAEALALPEPESMTAGRLARLADDDSAGAVELLDRYARNLSVGLVNLHQLLAPELFILHGTAASGGPDFIERIHAHFMSRVPPHPSAVPRIISPEDQDTSTLVGAAALVLSTLIT